MIDIDITRNDGESFIDFHKRANTERAVAEMNARRNRDDAIAKILRVESYQVRTVIDLTGDDDYLPEVGAYVVEYHWDKRNTEDRYWTAIINGRHAGHQHFVSRAMATLHALAHLDGDSNDDGHAAAATYAARVLGINPDG